MQVVLDTQVLYWGLMDGALAEAPQYAPTARAFVGWLAGQSVTLLVPTIVWGELLIWADVSEAQAALQASGLVWRMIDFDAAAALQFATMRRDHIVEHRIKALQVQGYTRRALVADVMIIATALVHGAQRLYSHNHDMLKLGAGYLEMINYIEQDVDG